MTWLFWRRPVVQLHCPEADAVSLVIDGYSETWPLRPDRRGNWMRRLHLTLRDLNGRAYYFMVHRNDTTVTIPDPLAHRTERKEHGLVSIFSDLNYRWQHRRFPTPPFRDLVIYEAHLPALSRHPSTPVERESQRGTYDGARSPAVLEYLQKLHVAVEFLPLHASDQFLGQDWGYYSTSFRALRESYAHDVHETNREVMALIDAMHRRGIPVLLDVVFNHGGELLVKAWGEDIVYRRHDNGDFCHGSGCGPTIRTEHPLIRETIIDTLQHLVHDYRIDGFRFDLGALHDKDTMLEIDRRLPNHVYLIAEPWALGGTQWGKGDMAHVFAHTRWAVWNDDFREPGRTFLMGQGDFYNRDRLMLAIKGTNIRDGGWAKRPQQCINYLSSHDGKTLADLVNKNQQRQFLGILMVLTAQGVPMLGEGSEMMFSKNGHDNSYDRPDLNQLDWNNARKYKSLVAAVAGLIDLRKRLPHFKYTTQLREYEHHKKNWDINWIYPTGHPHRDNVNALGFILRSPYGGTDLKIQRSSIVVLLNGSHTGADFHLPKGRWKVLADGLKIEVNHRGIPGIAAASNSYHVHAGTGVILAKA